MHLSLVACWFVYDLVHFYFLWVFKFLGLAPPLALASLIMLVFLIGCLLFFKSDNFDFPYC